MATEGFPEKSASSAPATTEPAPPKISEPIHNVLDTCQTDSEPVAAEENEVGAGAEHPEAPKPVQSTLGPNVTPSNHALGPSVATSEPEVPGVAQKAPESSEEAPKPVTEAPKAVTEAPKPAEEPTKPAEEAAKPTTQEPQVGEKRDVDSILTQTTGEAKPSVPESTVEKVDGPESKKQKTEQESTKDTNGTVSAPSTTTAPMAAAAASEEPKKAGRPKKEKIKEAVKKIIPTDGPGSRTRSRTKDT